jgi:hypothetical protein
MSTRSARHLSILLVAALVVGVACSSTTKEQAGVAAGGSSTADAPDATSPTGGTDDDASTSADDQAVVEAALVTLDDLPPGWEGSPADDLSDAEFDAPECGAIADLGERLDAAETARARSDAFGNEIEGRQIQQNVAAVDDADLLTEFLGQFEDRALARACLDAILTASVRRQLEANPSVVTIDEIRTTVNPLSVPAVGDQSTGYQVQIELTVNGESRTVYAEFVLVRVGRFAPTFSFSGSAPFRPVDRDAVVKASVARLEQAAG